MASLFDAHVNFGYSTVATAPSPATSGTSLVVQVGEGALFPAVPFNAAVWPVGVQPTKANAEIVRVTTLTGDTFTITRSSEPTATARTILVGDQIANVASKKVFTDIEAAITGQVTLTDGATVAVDASLGAVYTLSAGGDRTLLAPTNPTLGKRLIIRHLASGGARTLTLTTTAGGFHFGVDIPALSQTASGKYDYFGAVWNDVSGLWDVLGYVKGY